MQIMPARQMSKEKKLAIFIPSMRGGGAERSMAKLACGIAARGYPVDLVLISAEGPFLKDLSPQVHVVDLKAGRTLASLPALIHYLRSERPAAILSVMRHAGIAALWARRIARVDTRLVVNMQNTLSHELQDVSRLRARMVMSLLRKTYPWADAITAVSKGAARDMVQMTGFPERRVRVIHNPIITAELDALVRTSIDHPWFRRGQPPVVLGVGRLAPQKDFVNLIEAFSCVRQTHDARLLILGEGVERPKLEQAIHRHKLDQDILLPGYIDNPYPYMRSAGVFVLSSRFEGLPSVLIEALYCGAPLVATDCPSGPQEILEGGQYGQLTPVGDSSALAQAIARALDGQGPRATAQSWQPYALDTVVEQYCSLLLAN